MENLPQGCLVQMADEPAALGHGDDARLLGDDEHLRIRNFAHAQTRAVARTQIAPHARGIRQAQQTGRRDHAVAANHHRAVVQRGVRLEDVFDQRLGDDAVHAGAGGDYVVQPDLVFNDDQRADLASLVGLRALGASDVGLDVGGRHQGVANRIVDNLSHHVAVRTGDDQTGTLGRAVDLLAEAEVTALASDELALALDRVSHHLPAFPTLRRMVSPT